MPTALLETKLFVPRPRRGLVSRPRLSERLSQATASKLMLVSAPAGFGKTTLLAEWLAARSDDASTDDRQVGMVVARPTRQRPRGVLAVFRRRATDGRTRRRRECARASPTDAASADRSRAHRAAQRPRRAAERHHSRARRLSRHRQAKTCRPRWSSCSTTCPSNLHLVIGSRADPALPLARLRARGELVEIRAAELRFTLDEAAAYLTESMGLRLTAPDVATLEGRTEGWIAALQLAALSMQGRDDVAGFIAGLRGRRPLHRRLPRRRGARSAARRCSGFPCSDVDS